MMPVKRIGSAYQFDLPQADLPTSPIWDLLGEVDPGDYHVVFTGAVEWSDSIVQPRMINIALDLDGFNPDGTFADWESGIHAHVDESYTAAGPAQHNRTLVQQSVVHIPADVTLKMMRLDQSNMTQPVPLRFLGGQLVLTVVAPVA
jgi:hypothetical protein